ncbi:AraC family ligand binding domain-containing protein, partial [Streptomyces scabiei]
MSARGETRWTRATLGHPDRPLDLLTARFDRHRYAPHTHEEFSIGICVQGASCIDYRGGALTVGEGSIVVLAPGEVHTGESAFGTYAYRGLYPAPDLLTDGILGGTPHFRDPLLHDPELAAALRTAHTELSTGPDPLEAESR